MNKEGFSRFMRF